MRGFCTQAVTVTSHQAALGPAGDPELPILIKAIMAQRQLTLPMHRERRCPAREHPPWGAKHKVCHFLLVWNHLEPLCCFPILTTWQTAGQEAALSSGQRFTWNFDKCIPKLLGDISRAEVAPSGWPGTGVGDGESALLGRADGGTRGPSKVRPTSGPGNLVNSPCPFNFNN